MLVHEQGSELHLLLAVPDWWLGEGQEIRVQRAMTHFGPMGLMLRGKRGGVQAEITLPRSTPPKLVVLHLPRSRPLLSPIPGVEVRFRGSAPALGFPHRGEALWPAGSSDAGIEPVAVDWGLV